MPAVAVYGTPVPKGNHATVTNGGRARIIDKGGRALTAWQDRIAKAAASLIPKYGVLDGPLHVSATFTLERPTSNRDPWPTRRTAGDLDKLVRAALDGLTAGGLIPDDSRIVHIDAWRSFPDTPGAPDRLDRPGVLLRIETLTNGNPPS